MVQVHIEVSSSNIFEISTVENDIFQLEILLVTLADVCGHLLFLGVKRGLRGTFSFELFSRSVKEEGLLCCGVKSLVSAERRLCSLSRFATSARCSLETGDSFLNRFIFEAGKGVLDLRNVVSSADT